MGNWTSNLRFPGLEGKMEEINLGPLSIKMTVTARENPSQPNFWKFANSPRSLPIRGNGGVNNTREEEK